MNFSDVVVEIINSTFSLFIVFYFFSTFWSSSHSQRIIFVTFGVLDIILTITLLLLKNTIYKNLFLFVILVILASLFRSKLIHKIIYTVLVYGIFAASEMIIAIILTQAFSLDFNGAKDGILYLSGIMLSKFLSFLIILFIRLKRHNTLFQKFKKQHLGILLVPLATLSVVLLQHSVFIKHPQQSNLMYFGVVLCYTFLITANVLVFDFIDSLYNNIINDSKITTANQIIDMQTMQYQTLIEHHKHIIKLQHDIKHFNIGLLGLLDSGDLEAVRSELEKTIKYNDYPTKPANDIIHTLVDIKNNEARSKNISIEFEYHSLQKLAISTIDVAIILGNALDNAIEAADKLPTSDQKKVSLFVTLKNDNIIIVVKNPTHEIIDISNLISTKSDTSQHGFGILSMKQIASKYSGEVLFEFKDNQFITSIILTNSP